MARSFEAAPSRRDQEFRSVVFRSAHGEAVAMADYDEAFSRWPVPAESAFVETRHGRTWVISTGDPSATPVVLLHGAGSHSMTWAGDVSMYAQHFRAHLVDTPGEPGRSEGVRTSPRSPAPVEWLSDVLDGLGAGAAHLVGVSHGAWNALRFAAEHPRRVHTLTLMAPAGVCPPRLSFLLSVLTHAPLGTSGQRRLARRITAGVTLPPETVRSLDHLSEHVRPRVAALPEITDGQVRRLDMPVLCVLGHRDPIYPAQRVAARLQDLLPDVEVRILPEAGHLLLDTAPDVVHFQLARGARDPD